MIFSLNTKEWDINKEEVTMFEKEAEERTKQYMNEYEEKYNCENTKTETDNYNAGLEQGYEEGFQNGAEFGYNKANEWHKQDIDDIYDLISKDWDIRYFICIMKDKRRLTATGCCDEDLNGGVSVNLDFDHDDDKYYIDDIVWWKEIILPKR